MTTTRTIRRIGPAEAQRGELVTTVTREGYVSAGRLIGDALYVPGGAGWYWFWPASIDAIRIVRDGGAAFRANLVG